MSRRGRRQFLQSSMALAGLGMLAGCGPLLPRAQSPAKVARIGYLSGQSAEADVPLTGAFQQGLHELGYVEGENIRVEYRYTGGNPERLADLVSELIGLHPEVLVAAGTPQAAAAKQATDTIPVVSVTGDPIASGLVNSLSRPGGKVTGVSIQPPEINKKRLELLKETFPGVSHVAFLWNAASQSGAVGWRDLLDAAPALGTNMQSLEVRGPDDLEQAFDAAMRGQVDAVIVQDDPFLFTHRARHIDFSANSRLPTMYSRREYVADGGLMSYGERLADSFRRAATYVDKILRGADPADLPIEQPTSYDFALNLKTAGALGLTIPESTFSQATEVIR